MGVELVPTPQAPKNRSLAIRLIAKFHPLRMLPFGRSARVLKTLAMESSLKPNVMRPSFQTEIRSSLHARRLVIPTQFENIFMRQASIKQEGFHFIGKAIFPKKVEVGLAFGHWLFEPMN